MNFKRDQFVRKKIWWKTTLASHLCGNQSKNLDHFLGTQYSIQHLIPSQTFCFSSRLSLYIGHQCCYHIWKEAFQPKDIIMWCSMFWNLLPLKVLWCWSAVRKQQPERWISSCALVLCLSLHYTCVIPLVPALQQDTHTKFYVKENQPPNSVHLCWPKVILDIAHYSLVRISQPQWKRRSLSLNLCGKGPVMATVIRMDYCLVKAIILFVTKCQKFASTHWVRTINFWPVNMEIICKAAKNMNATWNSNAPPSIVFFGSKFVMENGTVPVEQMKNPIKFVEERGHVHTCFRAEKLKFVFI